MGDSRMFPGHCKLWLKKSHTVFSNLENCAQTAIACVPVSGLASCFGFLG